MPSKSSVPKLACHPPPSENVLAPENLPYQIRLLVQLLTRRFQAVIEPHGVTPLHWGVLSCLWQEDGLPTQAIATRLEQLGGTVTVGLDTMEKNGLVRRKQDRADGRVSRVWLTGKGAALQKKLVPVVSAFTAQVFSEFTEEERSGFLRMIQRLRKHVQQM